MHLATHGLKARMPTAASAGSSIPICAPARPTGCRSKTIWRCGHAFACPTLLVAGSESFLPDPEAAGVITHFRQAELVKIEGAGHWLQHDKPDEVIEVMGTFMEGAGRISVLSAVARGAKAEA